MYSGDTSTKNVSAIFIFVSVHAAVGLREGEGR